MTWGKGNEMDSTITTTTNGTAGNMVTIGSANTASTTGYYLNGTWCPYYPSTTQWYTNYTPAPDIGIRQVKNGFLVTANGDEYAFETQDALNKFINKYLSKKK